jgi:hypothetical protein
MWMKNYSILFLICLAIPGFLNAQVQPDSLNTIGNSDDPSSDPFAELTGEITDAETGEPLQGATFFVEELQRGTAADSTGTYEIQLPKGQFTVRVQFLGMVAQEFGIVVYSDGELNIQMQKSEMGLEEIIVEGAGRTDQLRGAVTGIEVVSIRDLSEVPVLMGEIDVINSLTSMAGVQTVGEGASGFNVRGGSQDQNLVLMNGAPIFNPSHILGLFSVFSPDATEEFSLYKGHMPEQFGGRLSSVLDVSMKRGSTEEFSFHGGIGLYTARATIEGPIIKNKTSYLLSTRGAASGVVFALAGKDRELARFPIDADIYGSSANFYDGYLNITHDFNENNLLSVSLYGNRDYFRYSDQFGYSWSNQLADLNWSSAFSDHLYSNLTADINRYDSEFFTPSGPQSFLLQNGIGYTKLKENLLYTGIENVSLRAGAEWTRYSSDDETIEAYNDDSNLQSDSVDKDSGQELSFYLGSEIDFTSSILLSLGVRHTTYQQLGPALVNEYEEGVPRSTDSIIGSTEYSSGEKIIQYSGFEPRLSSRFSINDKSSIKLSYNRTRQYIHQLSNTMSPTPADIWQVSTTHIPPQKAHNYSIGYYRNFEYPELETSLELYYRDIDDIVEYNNFAQLFMNPNIETELLAGKGLAYGAEFSTRKNSGTWTGWLSYTYGRIFVKADNATIGEQINDGDWFPASYDQPHQVNVTAIRDLGEESAFSMQFTWRSGRPITALSSSYIDGSTTVPVYSDRNEYRIPDYIRLDISFTIAENIWKAWDPDPNNRIESTANFTLYNVLGRKNAFSVFYQRPDRGSVPQAYKLSVLGSVIPSFTYNISF